MFRLVTLRYSRKLRLEVRTHPFRGLRVFDFKPCLGMITGKSSKEYLSALIEEEDIKVHVKNSNFRQFDKAFSECKHEYRSKTFNGEIVKDFGISRKDWHEIIDSIVETPFLRHSDNVVIFRNLKYEVKYSSAHGEESFKILDRITGKSRYFWYSELYK